VCVCVCTQEESQQTLHPGNLKSADEKKRIGNGQKTPPQVKKKKNQ